MAKRKTEPPELPDDLPRRQQRNAMRYHGEKRKPWEPTPFQLMVYQLVVKGHTYRQIAKALTDKGEPISFQRVGKICEAIDDYLAEAYIDGIRRMRVRHTEQLENIFHEAMEAWERSKGVAVTEEFEEITIEGLGGEQLPAKKTKRKEVHVAGAPQFLSEARGALADIRKIHAVDKNPKMVEIDENADDDRVAGKSRVAVIDEHIQRLQAAKEAYQVVTG